MAMSTIAGRPPNFMALRVHRYSPAPATPRSSVAKRPCHHPCSRIGKYLSTNGFRPTCLTWHRPVAVLHELHDGDVLDFGAGAEVLAIPGHTEGSIAIHLPQHGVLFTGDSIANVGTVMLGTFNQDRARAVASFQRLAALDVETACFGHGEPIASGAGARIREIAERL
jgi:glyoxylase-like metal-dependent hydrolase (beta-lactamase superfamily II)